MTEFGPAAARLQDRVSHWTEARWAANGAGDQVHGLVQLLADAAADAEGEPRRPVPRLADTALADQLAVVAGDLLAAEPPPPVLDSAAEAVATTARALP